MSDQDKRYLDKLYSRCDDGNGQACEAFGKALTSLSSENSSVGTAFIHRACQLAYRPSCGANPANEEGTDLKNAAKGATSCEDEAMKGLTTEPLALPSGPQGQLVTALSKGSVLERSGLQVGDVITRISWNKTDSARPTAGTLEITRKGAPQTLTVKCN